MKSFVVICYLFFVINLYAQDSAHIITIDAEELEIVNQRIYPILEEYLSSIRQCDIAGKDSTALIISVPPRSDLGVGGLSIGSVNRVDQSQYKNSPKGYFYYKKYLFIVYSKSKEGFHAYHWFFIRSENNHEFNLRTIKDNTLILDGTARSLEYGRLSIKYRYYPYLKEFEKFEMIRCNGDMFIISRDSVMHVEQVF